MNTPDKKPDQSPKSSRTGARLQHVVVLVHDAHTPPRFGDVLIFGQELDALRHIVGKPDWRYVAVPHGASVAEALKAAGS